MKDRSLVHEDFIATLNHFERDGKTPDERELARIAKALYELTYWHPPVIEFVNAEALAAMEARS